MKAKPPSAYKGDLRGWDILRGDIEIDCRLSGFFKYFVDRKDIKHKRGCKGLLNKLDVNVKLDIYGGIWKQLAYGPLEAEMALKDNNIYLNNSRIYLENGILRANGHIIRGENPELFFSGHIRVTDQPVDKFIQSIGIDYHELQGMLTMEALLSVRGREFKDLIPSLSGAGNISHKRGFY